MTTRMNFDLMLKLPLIKKYYDLDLSEFEGLQDIVFCEKIYIRFYRWEIGSELNKIQIRSIVNNEYFDDFTIFDDHVTFALDYIIYENSPSTDTELEKDYLEKQKAVENFIKERKW